jgi:CheY-like chemotaxis protein
MERHLLVIDDDDDDYDFIQMGLEKLSGVLCVRAKNAQKGLEMLRTGQHDVVLVDMNMPLINGLECLRMIKADPAISRIPIFIYTTENSDALCEEAGRVGAIDCLRKPYSIPAFAGLIRHVLDLSEEQAIRLRHQQGKGNT